jgi:F-type H+-transporting ATPase subunit delta
MTEQKVSLRFARALLNIAQAEKLTDTVYGDLNELVRLLSISRELRQLAESPVVQHWRKAKALKEILEGKISPLTYNFLMLLVDKGRLGLIQAITVQFEILYNLLNNKLVVEIISAIEMTDELKSKTIKTLSDITKKTILPTYKVDEKIQGGVTVQIGDWVYDASLSNQLELLHKRLAEDYN